jgi:oligoribonuclease (3'-5' exoribonuclease)
MEENIIKSNLMKISPVVDFIIGCAEILVSVTRVLFSQAEVVYYLSSQSFGQSITFTGGGRFIVQPLNHLANHLFYRIVDKAVNSISYQPNLTPST